MPQCHQGCDFQCNSVCCPSWLQPRKPLTWSQTPQVHAQQILSSFTGVMSWPPCSTGCTCDLSSTATAADCGTVAEATYAPQDIHYKRVSVQRKLASCNLSYSGHACMEYDKNSRGPRPGRGHHCHSKGNYRQARLPEIRITWPDASAACSEAIVQVARPLIWDPGIYHRHWSISLGIN